MSADEDFLQRLRRGGQVRTLFQPIFETSSGEARIRAVEALTRGPAGTNFEAADILFAYARQKRAEAEVDRLTLRAALASARGGLGSLQLHLNVHASTLSLDAAFADFLLAALEESDFRPAQVLVEVVEQTESLHHHDLRCNLDRLRQAGIAIGQDDVGLGASNFLMMELIRPGVLKVDRYFIDGLSQDPFRRAVVQSIQTLGLELGARVVAEGVESRADLETLRQLGVTEVQGYILSRPLTLEALRRKYPEVGEVAPLKAIS